MPLDRSSLVGQHPHADRGLDLYETDRLAVEALLLQVEKLPHRIWEPVAGRGAIARILRDHGHAVIASDIEDRGGLHFVADFLSTTIMPVGTECIVSNPPFKIIEGFIAHALELRPRVVMLAQLLFFEAGTAPQAPTLSPSPARVYAFRDRLPRMHRDRWQGRKTKANPIAFAWYVWDRNYAGPTTISRISARDGRLSVINAGDVVAGERSIMSKPTLRDVNAPDSSAEPEAISIKKPVDKPSLDKFKSKKEPLAKVATLPTELPILKIADARDYVRVHPDVENYWSPELCFVNVPIKGQKKDTLHLIDEDLALKYIPPGRIQRFRLALATKPDDILFLCQIPTRNLENDWNKAALKGIEQAKTLWTIVTSRKEEGVETYKVTWSEDPDPFPEPTWPIGEQTLEDIILTCFSGFCIDRADHPGLLRLRGKKQANS